MDRLSLFQPRSRFSRDERGNNGSKLDAYEPPVECNGIRARTRSARLSGQDSTFCGAAPDEALTTAVCGLA
jgi:hypothetical protein